MIVNATAARDNFFQIMSDVVTMQEPTYITSQTGNVVMISESDFKDMEETLYLTSIPGMREKIVEGLNTPLSECVCDG